MKTRIIAVLLLLAIASLVTASPACASRAAATAATSPECVVLEQPQRASIGAAAAINAHDLIAILPVSGPLTRQDHASLRAATAAPGAALERQPLLLVLRI